MRARCASRATAGLIGLALLALVVACGEARESGVNASPRPDASSESFLARHWTQPLQRQIATSSADSGAQAMALDPASCGGCHVSQYEDWRRSQHSRAMGPGVSGQLVTMVAADPSSADDCTRCHAPLAEQTESLVAPVRPGAAADARLHEHGLTCAGCHLRAGKVYGPPRRDGSVPGAAAAADQPHGGWTASRAFEDSGFCAACHQFAKDGLALNGKLLENTFDEWQSSSHAREGRTCQSCHMPGRRHLWRGIHDPDLVRQALTIELSGPDVLRGGIGAVMRIRNTGAGHHFPTYVTPRVVAEAHQEDRAGRVLPGTRRQHEIGRKVAPDLSEEIVDTRIASGGEIEFRYHVPRASGAAALVFSLRVEPDAFYRNLYASLLAGGGAGRGQAQIRRALQDATASSFIAYAERLPLAPADLAPLPVVQRTATRHAP